MKIIIGTCGVCGGPVTTYKLWSGVGPAPRSCDRCGREASYGPIIPMSNRKAGR